MKHTSALPLCTFLALVGITSSANAALVIGGWNSTRAGATYNIFDGSGYTGLRTSLSSNFPGATFSGTGALTRAYLSGVNLLIIQAIVDGANVPISPLSPAEQTALFDFVRSGGTAIIASENGLGYAAASASLVGAFGITDSGANLSGTVTCTITNPGGNPITSGPFGTTASLTYGFCGGYSALGPYATSLGTIGALTGLAYIPPNALQPGSGSVTFFSDTLSGGAPSNNLIFNIAATVPEPSVPGLGLLGGLSLLARRRREKRD